ERSETRGLKSWHDRKVAANERIKLSGKRLALLDEDAHRGGRENRLRSVLEQLGTRLLEAAREWLEQAPDRRILDGLLKPAGMEEGTHQPGLSLGTFGGGSRLGQPPQPHCQLDHCLVVADLSCDRQRVAIMARLPKQPHQLALFPQLAGGAFRLCEPPKSSCQTQLGGHIAQCGRSGQSLLETAGGLLHLDEKR